ncbi:MAG: response regulator [Chitinivibrionales bacterium]|nr:response regulator [Chitinivibrionales bacterium]MBD3396008.1 response regulator [Chitinivibrionales bacterium]
MRVLHESCIPAARPGRNDAGVELLSGRAASPQILRVRDRVVHDLPREAGNGAARRANSQCAFVLRGRRPDRGDQISTGGVRAGVMMSLRLPRPAAVPPEYRSEYAAELERINLQACRIVTFVGFLLVPASLVLDYFINPSHLRLFFAIRMVMAAGCLACYLLLHVRPLARFASVITMAGIFLVGGGIAGMIRVLGYGDPYYAGLNLIYLASMMLPWGATRTAIACFGVYSFYLLPILFFDIRGLDTALFVNNNVFQLETIIIAIIVNHFQSLRRNSQIVQRLIIAKQARELEEIDKYKREFIANITHELKTPLAIVMGNADLVLEQTTDPELRGGIELIRKAAFQLANHVDRIIAVSNVDDPNARPDLGNYDYCGVVQNAFSLFESKARQENITYALNMAPGPLVVAIDIVRMEEVLNNLIQNAFKFTPAHGIITVTVSTDGEKVFTEISDSGVGIPPEKIGRIFDRMYQADEVLSKRHGGMGLGLYISRKNVELHGGEISAHSKQGKGTSFRFDLPLHIDQSVIVRNSPYHGDERRATPRRSGVDRRQKTDRRADERRRSFEYQQRMGLDDLAGMTFADNVRDYENLDPAADTILIVEDNPGMMKVIVEALREDYNLLLAFDAYEAFRKLDTGRGSISLILSDIMMPGMSGLDFCERVMEREEDRHIPLIFITALMGQEDQLRGFAAGATDYIVKPYNIKILKEKVDHWISRRHYEVLLKEASSTLEDRVEQLSRVRDVILHEIRNPLQIITGANYFVERLRTTSYDKASEQEKQLWENVKVLQQGTEALTSVLEATQQLDMAQLSSRKPEVLVDILDDALGQAGHLLAGIDIAAEFEGMEDLRVNCDRRMIVQVLVNLLRNGAEAIRERSGEGKGRIDLSIEFADAHSAFVRVRDNGIGMDQEVVDKLFRFKFTTKKDGTGIGLHLSKMILKLHQGSISVDSRKGAGTTFTLHLPLHQFHAEPEPVAAS